MRMWGRRNPMLGWSVGFAILAVFATAVAYWGLAAGPAIGVAKLIAIVASVLFAIAAAALVVRSSARGH